MKYIYGIDIGGTTIKIGRFSTDARMFGQWEIETRRDHGGEAVFSDIAAALTSDMKENQIDFEDLHGIGLGVPGAVMGDSQVNECVNLGWKQVDVAKSLKQYFSCTVKAVNDANGAALGEFWTGSAKGYDSAVVVTLGTGVGAGIICDGHIISGSHGYAGELGHMTVNPTGERRCNCGKTGCLELYASATGLVYETKKMLEESAEPSILRDKNDMTAKDIFEGAKAGDSIALEQVDRLAKILALALGNMSMAVDPQIFVLGGGVSKAGDILFDAVRKYYPDYTYGAATDTKIVPAALGNHAGMYGAARLVL